MPADRTTTRTTTTYAVLGLLRLRPWTTYERPQQVRRSLNWFWPRSERKLYDELPAARSDESEGMVKVFFVDPGPWDTRAVLATMTESTR